MRVLIVEDDPDLIVWLRYLALANSATPICVSSPAEAAAVPVSQIDAAVVDWMLADPVDGVGVILGLLDRRPDLPVCLLSAAVAQATVAASDLGIPVLSKPAEWGDLLDAWDLDDGRP